MVGVGELAGLACAASWATTTLLVRHEARRANVLALNAISATTAAVYALLVFVALDWLGLHAATFGAYPWRGVALLLVATLFSIGIGDNLYFLALQRIGVARAMPVSMSEPLLATILAVLLFGEPVTPGLLAGLVLIPLGLYLVTMPSRGRLVLPKADSRSNRIGIGMAIGASLAWAFNANALRAGLEQVDVGTATVIRIVAGVPLVWLIAWPGRRWLPGGQVVWPRLWAALLAGTFTSAETFFFSLAVHQAGAARAATLAATSPLYAVPLSLLLLGEQATRWVLLGTLLTVGGVVLVVAA